MYIPAHFAQQDRDAVLALIGSHNFATLVTATADETWVTHLPLLHDPAEDNDSWGTLVGHVALVNGHWRAFESGRTVAIFQGPHAYVSPRWYEPKPSNVPTWNYAVVHAHGRPDLIPGEHVAPELRRLVARHEAGWSDPWTFEDTTEAAEGLRKGIVAFRMPVERVEAKFKLSQNRPAGDRERVIEGLADSSYEPDRATAELMRRTGG